MTSTWLPDLHEEYLRRFILERVSRLMALEERELRRLLGGWVSELEPILVKRNWDLGRDAGLMVGLGWVGDPVRIVVATSGEYNAAVRELMLWMV